MSTTSNASFDTMLNDYLTYDLLKEEMIKRDYLLTNVEKDDGWKGGNLVVPFKAAGASTITYGGLAAQTDVAEDKYVRGSISGYKEVWGTMLFNQKDLMEHDKVSEQNFLKILPDAVEDFMDLMKSTVSVNLLNGPHFAKLTADATANNGQITVDHPERFNIGQKVITADSVNTNVAAYVSAINMNTKVVTLVTTRGGATVFDFSLVGTQLHVVDAAKAYNDGAIANAFSDLKSMLLAQANGGGANLYGQSKIAYPYLQAINVDGSGVTSGAGSNILAKIFTAYVTIRSFGKGNPNTVLVSYSRLGDILQVLEQNKGAFNINQGSNKVSVYGWTEVEVGGVKGSLKIVGVQELDNDAAIFIDWKALKFHSNGFFRKRTAPDGKQYFEVRATTGYQYLLDMCLFGELVLSRPSYCGIMYNMP